MSDQDQLFNDTYKVVFSSGQVLEFKYKAIQLNRIPWREFVTQENPVAAALMAKMAFSPQERPRVKLECLRLLTTLRLDPAKTQLISGFIDTYLRLEKKEEESFQEQIKSLGLVKEELVREIVTLLDGKRH